MSSVTGVQFSHQGYVAKKLFTVSISPHLVSSCCTKSCLTTVILWQLNSHRQDIIDLEVWSKWIFIFWISEKRKCYPGKTYMLAWSILCKRATEPTSVRPQLLHKRISEVRTAGHWALKEAGIWGWCLWIGQCYRLKPSWCRSTCLQDLRLINSRALSKHRRVHVPEKGMQHKMSCFFRVPPLAV